MTAHVIGSSTPCGIAQCRAMALTVQGRQARPRSPGSARALPASLRLPRQSHCTWDGCNRTRGPEQRHLLSAAASAMQLGLAGVPAWFATSLQFSAPRHLSVAYSSQTRHPLSAAASAMRSGLAGRLVVVRHRPWTCLPARCPPTCCESGLAQLAVHHTVSVGRRTGDPE
jgi:hypothetical protein